MLNLQAIGEIHIRITGLMATFSACHLATKYMLQYITALYMERSTAAIMCYILIPTAALTCILHSPSAQLFRKSPFLQNSKIIFITITEGILCGYVLSDRNHYTTPPCNWFVPLGIAVATYTKFFKIGACREKLLFVSVGLGAIIELIFGMMVGITFSYLCISSIYVAIGYAAIQYYIRIPNKGRTMDEIYELSYVLVNVYTELLVSCIFASNS